MAANGRTLLNTCCRARTLCTSGSRAGLKSAQLSQPCLLRKIHNINSQTSLSTFAAPCLSLKQHCNRSSQLHNSYCTNTSTTGKPRTKDGIDLSLFPVEYIRNFSIVAHIDHGKSTLADRLLEWTGTIDKSSSNKQVLDKLQVERERGITVKAQTASLFYTYKGATYLLNLIDTPGHVDFSYEVSRSLAACQGIILLVDALQGVQAQTVANFFLAFDADLTTVPVLNKIDLKNADPARVAVQMDKVFDVQEDEIVKVSAKEGIGIEELLSSIVERVPSPPCDVNQPFSALLFDSWFDQYKGVYCLVAVKSGQVKKGDSVTLAATGEEYEVMDVGIMYPNEVSTDVLFAGQVGYMVCGIRSTREAKIGDTFYHTRSPVQALPGFKDAKPMVFAGIYPVDMSEHVHLRKSIEKLTLNDCSVSVYLDSSAALGQGWRLGFLGLLHMDVFQQRLQQEYDASVIVTTPNVPYKAILTKGQKEVVIMSPVQFPGPTEVEMYLEPFILGTIIFPDDYMGKVITLCENRRGQQKDMVYIDDKRVMLKYDLPLNEVIIDFFDQLKSVTSGFASFDYEDSGYRESPLVKLDILLNGEQVDALTCITHRDKAVKVGREVCLKLKTLISRQLFEIVIQGAVRGKIIARETIKPLRKDVLAKCYGGDVTRKRKLLERQKEGKKRLKQIGKVEIPHEAFLSLLKR